MSNVGKVVHYILPNGNGKGGNCVTALVLRDPTTVEHRGEVVGQAKTELRIYPSPSRDGQPERVVEADYNSVGEPGTWHFADACTADAASSVTASAATVETSGEEAN